MTEELIASAHVAFWKVEGKYVIRYKVDGAEHAGVYVPDGYFEGKCLKGFIENLTKK